MFMSDSTSRPGLSLSNRELDILNLLVRGCTNKVIADQLGLSIETVKTHMKRILYKLQVSGRTEAAVKAMKSGLVTIDY